MDLYKYKQFLWLRAIGELKADVRTSHMGMAWWFLDPLVYMGVFYLIFGVGLRQGGDDFVAFLLVGLVCWRWFDACVKKASYAIVEYRSLISQVYLPKYLLPLIPIVTNTLKFLIVYLMLVALHFFMGDVSGSMLLWLPVLLLSQLLLIVSSSLFLASVIPFVPDIKRFVDYGVTLLFFMSGIFYQLDRASSEAYQLFMLNPMAFYIESNRLVLLNNTSPDVQYLAFHVFASMVILAVAANILRRNDKTYPLMVQ